MSPQAFSYIASGAGAEETAHKNKNAFQRYSIVPKLLNDVSELDTSISLFGKTYPTPFVLAPVGVLKQADEQGDFAVTRAASKFGIRLFKARSRAFPLKRLANRVMGRNGFNYIGRRLKIFLLVL